MNFGQAFPDALNQDSKKRNYKKSDEPDWTDGLIPNFQTTQKDYTIRFSTWRVAYFYIAVIMVITLLTYRIVNLQIVEGKANRLASDGNRIQVKISHAKRGVIYDRNGEILTRNIPGFRIEKKDKSYQVISRDDAIKLITESDPQNPANIELDAIRQYQYPELLSHVLGYVSEITKEEVVNQENKKREYHPGDRIGRMGIESQYEDVLRGKDGKVLVEVDAAGIPQREMGKIAEMEGKSIVLNIDVGLQQTLKDALGNRRGAAVAVDPRSGSVLALVSSPTFNANLFTYGISQDEYTRLSNDASKPMFNRAVAGMYPPASTFKLITASAALEEKVVTPQTIIEDRGAIQVGDFTFRGWRPEGLGGVDIRSAIGKSSDIYFYTVAGGHEGIRGVGVNKLAEWATKFGLGQKTKIDLPYEENGLIPTPEWKQKVKNEQWFLGNTFHMGIGQGDVLATPLQMAMVTSVFANNGTLYQPQIIKEIKYSEGKTLKSFEPIVIKKDFISKSTIKEVKEGMKLADMPGGTAWPLFDFKISTGGKTGTAEFGDLTKTHAWFTVFAPFEQPEVVITVIVEGTTGDGGEGSTTAAPIARKGLEFYFSAQKKQ